MLAILDNKRKKIQNEKTKPKKKTKKYIKRKQANKKNPLSTQIKCIKWLAHAC